MAPALNPVVALSTYAAFRDQPSIVVLRLALTFVVAMGVGLIVSLHPRPAALLRGGDAHTAADHLPPRGTAPP